MTQIPAHVMQNIRRIDEKNTRVGKREDILDPKDIDYILEVNGKVVEFYEKFGDQEPAKSLASDMSSVMDGIIALVKMVKSSRIQVEVAKSEMKDKIEDIRSIEESFDHF